MALFMRIHFSLVNGTQPPRRQTGEIRRSRYRLAINLSAPTLKILQAPLMCLSNSRQCSDIESIAVAHFNQLLNGGG
jgi:hypothetical protein